MKKRKDFRKRIDFWLVDRLLIDYRLLVIIYKKKKKKNVSLLSKEDRSIEFQRTHSTVKKTWLEIAEKMENVQPEVVRQ